MKIIKNKKGELTTQQIVMLIILVTSFAIILLFLFRLNLGEVSNKEICHNSVVLKGKSIVSGNLDCRTNYLCISGGSKCEGINPTETIRVDLSQDNAKNEIMEAIADEMVDCWWMFGEGKVDYLSFKEGGILKTNTCGICSTIVFDSEILNKDYDIKYREFYEYLNDLKKDNSQTYFNYLYNFNNVDDFQEEKSYLKINLNEDSIINEDKFHIVTGIRKGAVWGFFTEVKFIYSYYAQLDKITQKNGLNCKQFITKA